MIRRPPRSTLFPTRRSSDLPQTSGRVVATFEQRCRRGSFVVEPVPVDNALRKILVSRWTDRTVGDRKSTRLNSSHGYISYAVFCLKKKTNIVPSSNDVSCSG